MQNFEKPVKTSQLPDQPLPGKMIDKLGSWSVKAQHYPIFSQTWFRYRALSLAMPIGVLGLILLVLSLVIANDKSAQVETIKPYSMFTAIFVGICLNLLCGRWLATLVKKRQWQQKKETAGIAIALLFGFIVSYALLSSADHFLDKKVKKTSPETRQQIQNLTKSDEVKVGLIITDEEERKSHLFNYVFWFILLLWWGGALDFRAYLRQSREMKDALLQEQLEQYKHERNQAQMRLSVLASQVEPHFLFNTLSGVRAAMLNDPTRGVAIIDHLVDYLRSTIPQMRSDGNLMLTTVRNQFDSVTAYLNVIRTRIPRLSFSVTCPPELETCAVPPLMLISLVENAVKHGIELKKGPVEIHVTASRFDAQQGAQLCLSVADNGVGFGASSSGSGIGLSNIRERLRQLHGNDASLELNMREQGGIEARIVLPLNVLDDH
ncbi:sensor histidine kinase [Undibacterium sp. Ji22W]|uniref:sensor histidine kinase n=1 Tax=Undibacterium sp. Ji22W TaxID=3413038 RepID=UPI003BF04B5E